MPGKDLYWTLTSGIVIYGLMIAIHAFCITGLGGWVIAGVEMFIMVPLVALLFAAGSIVFLPFSRTRKRARRVLAASGVLVQYPESGFGGGVERIERWIYVHE